MKLIIKIKIKQAQGRKFNCFGENIYISNVAEQQEMQRKNTHTHAHTGTLALTLLPGTLTHTPEAAAGPNCNGRRAERAQLLKSKQESV